MDEANEVVQEVPEVRLINTSSTTSLLPEAEVESTSFTTPWDEVNEVVWEVPEVRFFNTSSTTSLLPDTERSKALTKVLELLGEVNSASGEVISLVAIRVLSGLVRIGKKRVSQRRFLCEN